jgi:hypothetical protein
MWATTAQKQYYTNYTRIVVEVKKPHAVLFRCSSLAPDLDLEVCSVTQLLAEMAL